MNTELLLPRLLPVGLQPQLATLPEPRAIQLGSPGRDPETSYLHVIVGDDSASLTSVLGTDPISRRYDEAREAVRQVAASTVTETTKVAVIHFDHEYAFVKPGALRQKQHLERLLRALKVPSDAPGTSDLSPALQIATSLAEMHPDHTVTLTILSDWYLTDDDPSGVFSRLAAFPGLVHAVSMNSVPPLELECLINVAVTRVASADPPGKLAAAIAHSLTTGRPGRRPAHLRRQRRPRMSRPATPNFTHPSASDK